MALSPAVQQVKALTFDVFGTVVDWRNSIIREGTLIGQAKGWSVDWDRFATAWRGLYQPQMAKVRDGQMPWTNLDALHRMSLEQVLKDFGITGLTEPEIDHINKMWHRLDPWPDSVPGLRRLHQRYPLATLSNGNVALMMNMARRAGLPWDAILGAEVTRHYKPQPECYRMTAQLLGLPTEQCMLVAAHNSDLVAARAQGFRTAFVARPTEYGPSQKNDLKAEHDFDLVAASMVDLADQLGC